MEGDGGQDALRRIDAALTRIEQAATRPLQASAPDPDMQAELERLRADNAALDDAARDALRDLDALIGKLSA